MKTYKKLFLALALPAAILYSCKKDDASGTSAIGSNGPQALQVYLTDHATPVFDSVFIDLRALEIKTSDDNGGNDHWTAINIRPGVYNILRLRNGIDTLFGTGTLPNGRIKQLRLTLGTQNSVMKNNQSFPLALHDNDKQVIADLDAGNVDVSPTGGLMFWIDFDAGASIQVNNSGSGNNNGYRLKSHIRIFSRSRSGRLEGKVLPLAADAIVKAVNGSDTAMAVPDDHDGEFKIVGLKAGTYKVIYDGQNGYSDTTINNIIITNNEDRHLPQIILHQ